MKRVGFALLVIIGSQLFPQNPQWNAVFTPDPYATSFLSVWQASPGSSNFAVIYSGTAAADYEVQGILKNANAFGTGYHSMIGNGSIFFGHQSSETERITFFSISSTLWSGLSVKPLFGTTKEEWKNLSPTYFYNEYQKAHHSIIVFSQSTRSRA